MGLYPKTRRRTLMQPTQRGGDVGLSDLGPRAGHQDEGAPQALRAHVPEMAASARSMSAGV